MGLRTRWGEGGGSVGTESGVGVKRKKLLHVGLKNLKQRQK